MARLTAEARYLKVTSPSGAFRRAGLAFGKEPVVLVVDHLSDEQIASLSDELQLEIEEFDELPEGADLGSTDDVDLSALQPLHDEIARLKDIAVADGEQIDRLTKVNAEHEQTIERMGQDLARTIEERDTAQAALAELQASLPPAADPTAIDHDKPEGSEQPAATGEGEAAPKAAKGKAPATDQ